MQHVSAGVGTENIPRSARTVRGTCSLHNHHGHRERHNHRNHCDHHHQNPQQTRRTCSHHHHHHTRRTNRRTQCRPTQQVSLLDRILRFDFASLSEVFPFSVLFHLKEIIDTCWRCFQLRYQLIPIRFPGEDCPPEPEVQRTCVWDCDLREPCAIPESVDIHGLYECHPGRRDPWNMPTLPAHIFMNNGTSANGGCQNHGMRPNPSPSCHCCQCRPSGRRPPSQGMNDQEEEGMQAAGIFTRGSAVSLRIQLRAEEVNVEPDPDCCCQYPKAFLRKAPKPRTVHQISESTSLILNSDLMRQEQDLTLQQRQELEMVPSRTSNGTTECEELIKQGLELLREGNRLIEDNQGILEQRNDNVRRSSLLNETADKLTEAVNGNMRLLKQENETLKMTNMLLQNKLMEIAACQKQTRRGESRGKGDAGTATDPRMTRDMTVGQDDMVSLLKPAPSHEGSENGFDVCLPIAEEINIEEQKDRRSFDLDAVIKALPEKVRKLQDKVEKLEELNEMQRLLICTLQEKLHRQEIRLRDTLAKFDDTCRSMKLMFDGLKAKSNEKPKQSSLSSPAPLVAPAELEHEATPLTTEHEPEHVTPLEAVTSAEPEVTLVPEDVGVSTETDSKSTSIPVPVRKLSIAPRPAPLPKPVPKAAPVPKPVPGSRSTPVPKAAATTLTTKNQKPSTSEPKRTIIVRRTIEKPGTSEFSNDPKCEYKPKSRKSRDTVQLDPSDQRLLNSMFGEDNNAGKQPKSKSKDKKGPRPGESRGREVLMKLYSSSSASSSYSSRQASQGKIK